MADNYDTYTKDELIRLLRERDRKPKFGLVWERDEIEHDKSLNSDFVALDFIPELSCPAIEGDLSANMPSYEGRMNPPPQTYSNLIIEGDNFDAMRFLRMTHAGKVKCIYIDPPYNTGNRDFIYNDRFIDKDDAYKHSKWLEFMYQRLLLAKELLSEDGVIFVSIDDNEVFNLGGLMSKIFGENNFVATCIWQKKYSSSNDHKSIAPMHEYILVYQAGNQWQRNLLPRGEEKDKQYRFNDSQGQFRTSDYTCNKSASERPNLYYSIVQPNTGEEIWPKKTAVWRYSKERHEQNVQGNFVYWGKDGLGKVPSFKRYKHLLKNADGIVPTTWWTFEEVGHTDTAKKELLGILSEHAITFSTPKPTQLLERILRIATKPDDLVLDFFAGSGTTAHAVMKLNQEDGGNRRYILVSSTESTREQPDKNLCRDVCAERVRRVIRGYRNKKSETVEGLGGNFAYLRARRIPASRLYEDIQHEQIWLVLQLIHLNTFQPYDDKKPLQTAEFDHGLLVYCAQIEATTIACLQQWAGDYAEVMVYSWQPALLRQFLLDARFSIAPIPQFLLERFGMGAGL